MCSDGVDVFVNSVDGQRQTTLDALLRFSSVGLDDDQFWHPEFGAIGMASGLVRVSTVLIPSAVWLFGSGLIGLIGMARRKA